MIKKIIGILVLLISVGVTASPFTDYSAKPTFSIAGVWVPINPSTIGGNINGTVSARFNSLIRLPKTSSYGLVVNGWDYQGYNSKTNTHAKVSLAIFSPDSAGNLTLNTSSYIDDDVTNGSGSMVIADFNGDGIDDIFAAAHAEDPILANTSTAYISNSNGKYSKLSVSGNISAHDAKLVNINGVPSVLTATYDNTDRTAGALANPIFQYINGQFQIVNNPADYYTLSRSGSGNNSWAATLDSSGVIDNFGSQIEYVRTDISTFTPDFSTMLSNNIAVFPFTGLTTNSYTPTQSIVPLLSTLPQYQNVVSIYGKGMTHGYRVWSMDLNNDGFNDLLVGESMYNSSNTYPSALQVLLNKGDGTFIDKTVTLNANMGYAQNEFDYTPIFLDIDNSGIKTLFFTAGPGGGMNDRQSSYVLLNDGTGKLSIALHNEFYKYQQSMISYLNSQNSLTSSFFVPSSNTNVTTTTQIANIAIPQNDGSINFLMMTFLPTKGTPSQIQYLAVNVPMHYNPKVDFTQNITISDRNQSKLMRTWAGSDVVMDTNANSSPAHIDGGLGVNTAVYSDVSTNYSIKSLGVQGFGVKHTTSNSFPNVDDTLVNFQYLKFSDAVVNIGAGIATTIDSYDMATGQLTIPVVSVGSDNYKNVIVKVGSVLSVGSAPANSAYDSFNSANGQLTIPMVTVGSTTYYNVVVSNLSVLTVGGKL
jgi:hypothetical protein